MNAKVLEATAKLMVANGKGLGGQTGELASVRVNAMNVRFKPQLPGALSFSFGRAIQQPALEIWDGKQANVAAAQQAPYHRAKCDRAACLGEYDAAVEADHGESTAYGVRSEVYAGAAG